MRRSTSGGSTGEGTFSSCSPTADDARVYFPKWGVADGRAEIKKRFGDVGSTLSAIEHHYEYYNYAFAGDVVVVEGTSHGATAGGVTHAGRF